MLGGFLFDTYIAITNFRVAIIPYTYEHTNFKDIRPGSVVNIEFDIIGKYIARLMKGYTEGR